jgi:hypothetical protein
MVVHLAFENVGLRSVSISLTNVQTANPISDGDLKKLGKQWRV